MNRMYADLTLLYNFLKFEYYDLDYMYDRYAKSKLYLEIDIEEKKALVISNDEKVLEELVKNDRKKTA